MPLPGTWLGVHIDQIALLAPDLQPAMAAYHANLGVTFRVFEVDETNSSFSGSSATFRTRIAVTLNGPSIEIIQPVAGTTLHSEHLRVRGPGLHHLGVYVDELSQAVESLSSRGYKKILEGKIDRVSEFAYFDAGEMHCIIEPLHLSSELPLFLAEHGQSYP